MEHHRRITLTCRLVLFFFCLIMVGSLSAKDDLNCLACHQYKGLIRAEPDGSLRSFFVDQKVFEGAVHDPLTCETCHDNIKQVPHLAENIRPVDCSNECHLEESPNYKEGFNHKAIKASYDQSRHGLEIEDTPRCNYCHPQHRMTRLTKTDFREIVALCSSCHADNQLMLKHDKTDRPVVLYRNGVHRRARYYGDEKAAYCVSCHNPHEVLKHTDPKAITHKNNRVKICSQTDCHPKATTTFASNGAIHNTYGDSIMGLIMEYMPPIYVLIIIGTIAGMFFHQALDFSSYVIRGREVHPKKPKSERRYFVRMTVNERLQHLTLLLSFITLAVSGFMLKIPREWILHFTPNLEKVYLVRWYVHRVAACTLALVSLYHVSYLALTKRGRYQFWELVPNLNDLQGMTGMMKYYFGLSKHKPRFEHYDYKEKIEYWALVWGNFIMILTGSMIWFKVFVPKAFIDVAFLFHQYEAILAVLAIVVWHWYTVFLKPDNFPMNPLWITGKISEEHLIEEHGLEYIKLTGQEIHEHADVKYSRRGPIIGLVVVLLLVAFVAFKSSDILNAVTREMDVTYEKPTAPLLRDTTPSVCQECHGSYPHTENRRLRAFANRHAMKFYCEACHLMPREKSQLVAFGWYNGKEFFEGEDLPPQKALSAYVVENGAKIPLLMDEKSIDPLWQIVRNERRCQFCHYGEAEPKSDFVKLGYDKEQQLDLTNSRALGMLIKRKTFYFYAF